VFSYYFSCRNVSLTCSKNESLTYSHIQLLPSSRKRSYADAAVGSIQQHQLQQRMQFQQHLQQQEEQRQQLNMRIGKRFIFTTCKRYISTAKIIRKHNCFDCGTLNT
jgi:uncharacterized protein YqiB (DUF1249 family)